ncbi:MAG TPA: MerR family transcriptional regulator [Pyrinomonadaceae bacterium]|nr:MerR family transcriptional regulator [Pyrinomonadaceae bacterium]
MAQTAVVIPEKIFFKIGEVCDIVGVQAHVLRYWESEFSVLSPQKNKSGQRSYRRKDVETALKIKQLLYNEMFTIAGARKKLIADARQASRGEETVVAELVENQVESSAPTLFDTTPVAVDANDVDSAPAVGLSTKQREALRKLSVELLELREMLKKRPEIAAESSAV